MKIRTIIILAGAIALLALAPALAEPEYLVPRSRSEIRALEIQLQIRIEPEKTLWYRIDVVESAASHHAGRAPQLAAAKHNSDPNNEPDQIPATKQIKDGITVVRTIRAAAVTLVKHLLKAAATTSEGQ
jgi:hypothetical protein